MPAGPWMEQTSSGKPEGQKDGLRRLLRRSRRVAVFDRHKRKANVLEVVNRQPRQQVRVDLVVPELLFVLAEPKTASHPPTSIAAPHWLGRMIAQTRRQVQQRRLVRLSGGSPRSRRTALTMLELVLHQYERIGGHVGVKQCAVPVVPFAAVKH